MKALHNLLLASVICVASAATADALHDRLAKDGIAAATTWQTSAEDLLCAVTKNASGETNKLRCYSRTKADPIATFDIDPGLIQLQVLGRVDGPLIASWGTGSGYGYAAYAYRDGVVKRVWSDGSFLPFEALWADARAESMVLVLAEPAWVEVNGEKEKVAGEARLFAWKDSSFTDIGTSAWKDRQKYAADHAQESKAK